MLQTNATFVRWHYRWQKKGYLFFDASESNVGYTQNNTPVVLDRGAVIPLSKVTTWQLEFFCHKFGIKMRDITREASGSSGIDGQQIAGCIQKHWRSFYERIIRDYDIAPEKLNISEELPAYDYASAQKDHLRAFGLQSGKVVGVVDAERLAAWEKQTASLRQSEPSESPPGQPVYTQLVRDGGGYRGVVRDVLRPFEEEAKNPDTAKARHDGSQGFCHRIDAARRNTFEKE